MTYRIYEGETLVNTIVADETFAAAYCREHGYTCELVEPPATPMPEPMTADEIMDALEHLEAQNV